jgi:hypothetical protein
MMIKTLTAMIRFTDKGQLYYEQTRNRDASPLEIFAPLEHVEQKYGIGTRCMHMSFFHY